jgi:hypothetical protein
MKLSDLITKLEAAGEQGKALAAEVRSDIASIGDVDTKDLAAELAAKADLTAQVAKLGEDIKGVEELRATVAGFQAKEVEAAIGVAFETAAKEHGLNPAAIKTARKLLAPDAIKVDGGKVVGLTKELFTGLKTEHPLLFAEAKKEEAAAAAPSVPALPPAGAGAAATPAMEIPGAMGMFLKAQ